MFSSRATTHLFALSLPILSFGCAPVVEDPTSCTPEANEYTIYVIPTADDDISGLSIMGKPVVALTNAVNVVALSEFANAVPPTVSIKYNAPLGTLLFNIPLGPDSGSIFFIDTAGPAWVHMSNPVDETIVHLSLVTADGQEILPFHGGMSGALVFPLRLKTEFALVGLPQHTYTKIKFETNAGKQGELLL